MNRPHVRASAATQVLSFFQIIKRTWKFPTVVSEPLLTPNRYGLLQFGLSNLLFDKKRPDLFIAMCNLSQNHV
jgi:hypothetical protein